MIKYLTVTQLNGRMNFSLTFNDDINVITGKNGSGKTTLLKLLWYAISGNLERIVQEIQFERFELLTDTLRISMHLLPPGATPNNKRLLRHIRLFKESRIMRLEYGRIESDAKSVEFIHNGPSYEALGEGNATISRATESSVFFPTFRRIEGGFSLNSGRKDEYNGYTEAGKRILTGYPYHVTDSLSQAMNELSERVSVGNHRFVASISTDDLDRLLTSKFAEVAEASNKLHMELSAHILTRINDSSHVAIGDAVAGDTSSAVLAEIMQRARHVTQQSDQIKRPFTVLADLITTLFQYKGITLNGLVTLGEAKEAILSEVLSAGEKQMLSFLCYNAFAKQTCLFIDEPEISLHVDWQRLLFPILLKQSTGNQFIVATHSPFIYSKYADKELVLAESGDTDADAFHD